MQKVNQRVRSQIDILSKEGLSQPQIMARVKVSEWSSA